MDSRPLLAKSSRDHFHLCPRQILGVRIVLAGMSALGFDVPPAGKRLLVITGTDGCFVDGVIAATAGVPARWEGASGRARCAVFAAHR